jgi:hypothetical protein
MTTLKINMPNLDPDAEVEVTGLGVFKNMSTQDLTDDQRVTFAAVTGRVLKPEDTLVVGHPDGRNLNSLPVDQSPNMDPNDGFVPTGEDG